MTSGILEGEIDLLQLYLRNRYPEKKGGVLQSIIEHGLHAAMLYLKQRRMKEAGQLIANIVCIVSHFLPGTLKLMHR